MYGPGLTLLKIPFLIVIQIFNMFEMLTTSNTIIMCGILSTFLLSQWDFVLWDFVLWDFVRVGFCPGLN